MNFIKISLTISLIGIIILLILTNLIEPKLTKIKDITIKQLNKKVKIFGKIENIKNYETKTNENFQVLTISDETDYIETILNKDLNVKKDQKIIVIGRVMIYKDKLQIQAEKIVA